MAIIELSKATYKPYAEKMEKSVHVLQENLNAIRAGRANPKVLDRLAIDYYGVQTPINQVANIQVPEPRMITITPWDPSTLKIIEKSIQASDLGINPTNDGKMLRLVFPALTEERRKDLVKTVHREAEDAKIAIRNIRREALDKFRGHLKKKELTEDGLAEVEVEIQKLTDGYIENIDKVAAEKEKDLMEI
ncbi:MAG: ribosome recycling factor [Clostridia bacterium]|nr:ribosome recycling factor [Eubacteriales bacterium]MDD4460793.1 ribosome recycling factor [Eubacteriales bacterium]NCC48734.1 ribosome recycling factor [Clostridia bacterium]